MNDQQPKKSSSQTSWLVLVVILLVIIGGAIYIYIKNTSNKSSNVVPNLNTTLNKNVNSISNRNTFTNLNTETNTNISTIINLNANTSSSQMKYKIEYYSKQKGVTDSRLVYGVGDSYETLIESTQQSAGLKEKYVLGGAIFSPDADIIFLYEELPDSDVPLGAFWQYTVSNKKLDKLPYFTAAGFFRSVIVNQIKTKAVYVSSLQEGESKEGNDKKLYVIDLLTGELTNPVSLGGDETFNAGWGGLSSIFEISWKTDNIVKYSVFNQTTQSSQFVTRKEKIAEREVNLFPQ